MAAAREIARKAVTTNSNDATGVTPEWSRYSHYSLGFRHSEFDPD